MKAKTTKKLAWKGVWKFDFMRFILIVIMSFIITKNVTIEAVSIISNGANVNVHMFLFYMTILYLMAWCVDLVYFLSVKLVRLFFKIEPSKPETAPTEGDAHE